MAVIHKDIYEGGLLSLVKQRLAEQGFDLAQRTKIVEVVCDCFQLTPATEQDWGIEGASLQQSDAVPHDSMLLPCYQTLGAPPTSSLRTAPTPSNAVDWSVHQQMECDGDLEDMLLFVGRNNITESPNLDSRSGREATRVEDICSRIL
jgi:hypothetical protein